METKVAGPTVSVVEPVVVPELAVIVVLPLTRALARPVALTVAAPTFDELQLTALLRSLVLPSVKLPVAVNCSVVPAAIEELAGEMVKETNPEVTVRVVLPLVAPEVALIVEAPVPTLLARPCVPEALLIVTTVGAEDPHCTVWEMF